MLQFHSDGIFLQAKRLQWGYCILKGGKKKIIPENIDTMCCSTVAVIEIFSNQQMECDSQEVEWITHCLWSVLQEKQCAGNTQARFWSGSWWLSKEKCIFFAAILNASQFVQCLQCGFSNIYVKQGKLISLKKKYTLDFSASMSCWKRPAKKNFLFFKKKFSPT